MSETPEQPPTTVDTSTTPTYLLRRDLLAEARKALIALKGLDDYAPFNQQLTIESIMAIDAQLTALTEQRVVMRNDLNALDNLVSHLEWMLYQGILAARQHCVSQYGPNSDIVEAMGLKKKAAYKRGGRSKPKA